jgi:hypothetical protein
LGSPRNSWTKFVAEIDRVRDTQGTEFPETGLGSGGGDGQGADQAG